MMTEKGGGESWRRVEERKGNSRLFGNEFESSVKSFFSKTKETHLGIPLKESKIIKLEEQLRKCIQNE